MSSEEQIREDAANPGEEIRSLRKQIEYHSDRYLNHSQQHIGSYKLFFKSWTFSHFCGIIDM